MCGLAGVAQRSRGRAPVEALQRMTAAIRHRGPDGYGFYADDQVALGHVRLALIDVAGGAQPMTNEDGSVIVVLNGEIYNHIELRSELVARGHQFRSASDTEVVVHGWEVWGSAMLTRLIGQFAMAVYDRSEQTLFLARDRFGVRPLFIAEQGGDLWFCSEAKGLFASGRITAAPDPQGLNQVFTTWGAAPPRSVFAGVKQLEPGCWALWRDGRLRTSRYYELAYDPDPAEPHDAVERLDELLQSSVAFRMGGDEPVGGYLSGGLDSAIVCSLASDGLADPLRTFSITFEDPEFDESLHQHAMARAIGSEHVSLHVTGEDIAGAFPDVVWHMETPVVRTAPVPMFLLAKLTRESGVKVVLSGEGADELFLGYDLFKEAAVRRFCLRQPTSRWRPRLFERLYPYLPHERGGQFWQDFFLTAGTPADPLFSHLPRFRLSAWIREFYSDGMRQTTTEPDVLDELRASLPTGFAAWAPAHQAAYLEMSTLLSPYLLSAQSDRVGMAWGIEGRFPFLDHRVFEFASRLPVGSKLRGLREKDILRRVARRLVPAHVTERNKQPYRAPEAVTFRQPSTLEYLDALLAAPAISRAGYFRPDAVAGLRRRLLSGIRLGARENQALIAILSTQLWHEQFFENVPAAEPLPLHRANVLIGAAMPTLSILETRSDNG